MSLGNAKKAACVRQLTIMTLASMIGCGGSANEPSPTGPSLAARVAITAPSQLFVGDSLRVTATAYDATGVVIPAPKVEWAIGMDGIVSITADGIVRGLKPGAFPLQARVDTAWARMDVTVARPAPARIVLTAGAPDLDLYSTRLLAADVYAANGYQLIGDTLSWQATPPLRLSAPTVGFLRSIAYGSGVVTVRTRNGVSASATLAVPRPTAPEPLGPWIRWDQNNCAHYLTLSAASGDSVAGDEQSTHSGYCYGFPYEGAQVRARYGATSPTSGQGSGIWGAPGGSPDWRFTVQGDTMLSYVPAASLMPPMKYVRLRVIPNSPPMLYDVAP